MVQLQILQYFNHLPYTDAIWFRIQKTKFYTCTHDSHLLFLDFTDSVFFFFLLSLLLLDLEHRNFQALTTIFNIDVERRIHVRAKIERAQRKEGKIQFFCLVLPWT